MYHIECISVQRKKPMILLIEIDKNNFKPNTITRTIGWARSKHCNSFRKLSTKYFTRPSRLCGIGHNSTSNAVTTNIYAS